MNLFTKSDWYIVNTNFAYTAKLKVCKKERRETTFVWKGQETDKTHMPTHREQSGTLTKMLRSKNNINEIHLYHCLVVKGKRKQKKRNTKEHRYPAHPDIPQTDNGNFQIQNVGTIHYIL